MVKQWSLLALVISSSLSQVALAESVTDQADAKGFVDGSTLTGVARNYYLNRNREEGRADQRDWTQGVMANYISGFTQGTIGFGVDAYAYGGLKLDSQRKYANTGNLPLDRNGDPQDAYGSLGGALKLRISRTQLKYGEMQPTAPVFAVGGVGLLDQTATGFDLTSNEIAGLNLEAGHFTATNGGDTTNHEHDIFATYANVATKSASFVGGKYTFTPDLSATVYAGELQDVWRQYYTNLNYVMPLSNGQSVTLDGNLYRTLDTGSANAGTINTTAYSLAAAYSFLQAHTLTLSFQKIDGNEPFDYIGAGDNGAAAAGDSILLANSVQWSDFNGPGEASWALRYDLNMAPYGVPGLSFMSRYINGSDIDGSHTPANSAYLGAYGDGAKEHETDVEVKYVVQSGPAKNLAFRLRQAYHTGSSESGSGGDVNDTRLIVNYPFSIL
ncbi:OprD family porin [Pseudomonas sp. TH32]|jgi:imipenem/basic amino acid-specific outer membrane pore|uniref:OprD family porin n=1 Tax=Pseudomonas sp. TH32 TaxID=2796397 RepID=UPI00191239F1|nr:OprD family porin [Pseudomonas sp. TH32]MBK5437640.1 OprD family porin [Pseudomonas sp. TH32]